ncbi:phorbol-12-myristate-13-acetate-induced protein 1 isoform X2 [Paroedura picta]|uniref:phorbol-12-myristate-13-acetate-induced protein 1 isoform X2 n=1 Tax=Paroedura picta TaxID=143630 RepID=UPI0040574D02
MPGKAPRKPAPPNAAPAGPTDRRGHRPRLPLPTPGTKSEAVTECALQLRKIGDKLNVRQRILNLIAKLLCPGTQDCLE